MAENRSVPIPTLAVILALLAPVPASAFSQGLDFHEGPGGVALTPSVSVGRMGGETLYRIGGDFYVPGYGRGSTGFTISELEFPLDAWTGSVGLSAAFGDLLLRLGVTKSLTSGAGRAEDSDWGVWYLEFGPPYDRDSLDIFSESDAELDALMLQADLLYRLVRRGPVTLAAGLGWRYQRFAYELSDLDQWYPSFQGYTGEDAGHDLVPGKVGTYEVTCRMPMLEAAAGYRPRKDFGFHGLIGWSPLVRARDEDDHILRSKLSRGEADGTALLLDLGVEYRPASGFFAGLGFEWLRIAASGTQEQTWYETTEEALAGDWLRIDQDIRGTRYGVDFTVGWRF